MNNISKTIQYMKKAADNAAANMAQQEALDWIEKGTKLLDTVPEFEGKARLKRSFQLQMSGIKMSTLRNTNLRDASGGSGGNANSGVMSL